MSGDGPLTQCNGNMIEYPGKLLGIREDVWGRSFDTVQWKYDRIPWEAIRYHKGKEKGRKLFDIYVYCLMDYHVHLLIKDNKKNNMVDYLGNTLFSEGEK